MLHGVQHDKRGFPTALLGEPQLILSDPVIEQPAAPFCIGVDSGGTFTDMVVIDGHGRIHFDKAFSTPRDPAQGVLAALEACASLLRQASGEIVRGTSRFAHGTTVATNALIQRRGARVGLLMTKGFEDTTIITRGPVGKNQGIPPVQAMDFIHNERPDPLVPKTLIRGVTERIAADGTVVAPLGDDLADALRDLAARDVESLAVCLLWSFRNDAHERRIKEFARELLPHLPVYLSSEVSPLLGEFERATTTTVNAYIGPVISTYVKRLQARLAEMGLEHPVQLMTCSGGLTLPDHIDKEAVSLVNSGPVGGLVASRYVGQMLGLPNVSSTDMGGTSFDVGMIRGGEYEYEQEQFLAQGLPVQIPAVKVVTVGAGGGSIAWSDGHRLMVGPQSAGADPGPACYDRGGSEPTVTDALVVLGLLDPEYFFGGRKKLVPARAEAAIRDRVARPLGLDTREAAAGIYEIVTAKMSDLIRKVTVESGYDPREFAVFAYGGAGPAHAVPYAAALGVKEVVVPHTASVFSALGCALSDIKYVFAKSQPMMLESTGPAFDRLFDELERRALADMAASGFSSGEVVLARSLDVRYEGQMSQLTLPWHRSPLADQDAQRIRQQFEDTYEMKFGQGTTRRASSLEIINFRVEALKVTEKPAFQCEAEQGANASQARKGSRDVYLRQFGSRDFAIFEGEALQPGNCVPGPAIVERRDTTILIPPGHEARMDGYRNLRITAQ